MNKIFSNLLLASPVVLGIVLSEFCVKVTAQVVQDSLPVPSVTSVTEEGRRERLQPQAMSQVTSVSQLSDVQPTDWAFQALQSFWSLD